MTLAAPLSVLAAAAGTCLGSFVTTAALRAARSEQALYGRSRCDGCGAGLGFAQTLPILSYVRRRGACSSCGERIEPAHLAGEIAGGAIAFSTLFIATEWRGVPFAGLGFVLLGTAVYDTKTRKLPDLLTFAAVLLCGALAAQAGTLASGAVAALVAFGMLEGVRRGFLWLRRAPGLGFGDVKLIAALALWLGALTSWAIVLASILGLLAVRVVRPADGRIAFGPMIALAAFVIGWVGEAGWWPV